MQHRENTKKRYLNSCMTFDIWVQIKEVSPDHICARFPEVFRSINKEMVADICGGHVGLIHNREAPDACDSKKIVYLEAGAQTVPSVSLPWSQRASAHNVICPEKKRGDLVESSS